MAYIPLIDETDAQGPLAAIYKDLGGRVGNILKVHGENPGALRAHLGLYREIMFGESRLSRREREMIAVVVSRANNCHY